MTVSEGMRLFNEYRETYIDKISKTGKMPHKAYNDIDILKILRTSLKVEFVKSDLYIRFASQRELKMRSRLPNVTVMVVNNPKENIQKPSIKSVKQSLNP